MDIQNFFEKRKQATALATLDRKFVSLEKLLDARNNITKTRTSLASDILQSAAKKRKEDLLKQKQSQEKLKTKEAEKEEKKEENPLFKNKLPVSQFLRAFSAIRFLPKLAKLTRLTRLIGLLRFANPWVLGGLAVFGGVLFLASKTNLFEGIRNAWESVYNFNIPGLPSLRDITEGIQGALPELPSLPSLPGTKVLPGGQNTPSITGGTADFWTLAALASLESGSPQGRADVAQSVYNRVASGAYKVRTIKEAILSPGQYQPATYDGADINKWRAIKDRKSAIAAVESHRNGKGRGASLVDSAAAAITNPTLQANAAQWVGGRTDFAQPGAAKKYPGGLGFKTRHGHLFGWYVGPGSIAYGKTNPKAAAIPNFNTQQAGVQPKGKKGPKLNVKGRTGDQLKINSGYGPRGGTIHRGLDLDLASDTPWGLTVPSKIISSGWYGNYGYLIDAWMPSVGKMLRIAHNNKLLVKQGQNVDAGKVIALSGNTGRSFGPHLHVEVRDNADPYSQELKPTRQDMKYIIVDPQPLSAGGTGGPMNNQAQTIIAPMQTPTYTKKNIQANVSPAMQVSLMDNQELMYLVA